MRKEDKRTKYINGRAKENLVTFEQSQSQKCLKFASVQG